MTKRKTPTGKQLRAEQRRSKVIEAISQGQTVEQIAQEQNVSPKTITRDKMKLMKTIQGNNQSEMQLYREEQLAECAEMKRALEDERIDPAEKIRLTLGILDRKIKLLGTAAPTRSMHLNANVTGGFNLGRAVDPNIPNAELTDDELYYKVGRSIHEGHTKAQLLEIQRFADSLIRRTPEQQIEDEIERTGKVVESMLQPAPDPVEPAEIILDPIVDDEDKIQ